MQFLWELMAFLLMLTPLVFVHELGHFIFAKLFNVKVTTFSIFMGKKLLRKKWGETEYCISAIPIGGYVSLLGEDPTSELPAGEENRSLYARPPLQRFLVVFAGPAFNVLLTFLLFTLIISLGDPVPSNRIARVVPFSKAREAGILTGDKIIRVNEIKIKNFRDFSNALKPLINTTIELEVLRKGIPRTLHVKTSPTEAMNKFGKSMTVGFIEGIEELPLNTLVGIPDPNSKAGRAGMKTGDLIISINGKEIALWKELEEELLQTKRLADPTINIIVSRNKKTIPFRFRLTPASKLSINPGIESAELYVHDFLKGYPAEKAGMLKNDRLVAVKGKVVHSFNDFYLAVQKLSDSTETLSVTVNRNGKLLTFEIQPRKRDEKDIMGEPVTHFYIGVRPYQNVHGPAFMVKDVTEGIINIITKAILRTVELTEYIIISFGKLLTGAVSPRQLAGPLMISKIASDILSIGALIFLQLMAMISLNLAIINLVPFPALDGGHIFILGVEALIRRKLPVKAMAFINYIGFFVLMSLTLVVTLNDIIRRFF